MLAEGIYYRVIGEESLQLEDPIAEIIEVKYFKFFFGSDDVLTISGFDKYSNNFYFLLFQEDFNAYINTTMVIKVDIFNDKEKAIAKLFGVYEKLKSQEEFNATA